MENTETVYEFELSQWRRVVACLYVLFIAYPSVICRYLFRRNHTGELAFYILFFPLLFLRSFLCGFASLYPFAGRIDYKLTVHKTHLSFGPNIETCRLANGFETIKGIYKVRTNRFLLYHDGHVVYLPTGEEGKSAAVTIASALSAKSAVDS